MSSQLCFVWTIDLKFTPAHSLLHIRPGNVRLHSGPFGRSRSCGWYEELLVVPFERAGSTAGDRWQWPPPPRPPIVGQLQDKAMLLGGWLGLNGVLAALRGATVAVGRRPPAARGGALAATLLVDSMGRSLGVAVPPCRAEHGSPMAAASAVLCGVLNALALMLQTLYAGLLFCGHVDDGGGAAGAGGRRIRTVDDLLRPGERLEVRFGVRRAEDYAQLIER